MTSTSSTDDSRQDERRIKELRAFQRSHAVNKRCFDCNEMMPQYVCLDFNTFVCTSCSGIHREFAHRVKSISMAKFTDTEVKNVVKFGGNEAALKYWRATFDSTYRLPGSNDRERIRSLIRLTYIDRQWVYESPRGKTRNDDLQPQNSPKSKQRDSSNSKSSKKKSSFDAFANDQSSSEFADFGDFSSFEKASNNGSKASDFGDFSSTTTGDDAFGDFNSFEESSTSKRSSSTHSSFKIAPPPGSTSSSSSLRGPPPAPTATHDFLAFSPDRNDKKEDPFGFDAPPSSSTSSFNDLKPAATSSFDAFDNSAPSTTGKTASTSSFDEPFSTMGTSNAFDAFGSDQTQRNSFDAFGSTPAASNSTSFDGFGSSNAGEPSSKLVNAGADNPFAAFSPRATSESTSGSPFDAFSSSSVATSSSLAPSDPFSMPSSGSASKAKPTESLQAQDPFAAFEGIGQATAQHTQHPSSNSVPSTDPFAQAHAGASHMAGQTTQGPYGQQMYPGGMSSPYPNQQPHVAYNGMQGNPVGGHPGSFPMMQQPNFQPMHGAMPPHFNTQPGAPLEANKQPADSSANIRDPFASLNIGKDFGLGNSAASNPRASSSRTSSGNTASMGLRNSSSAHSSFSGVTGNGGFGGLDAPAAHSSFTGMGSNSMGPNSTGNAFHSNPASATNSFNGQPLPMQRPASNSFSNSSASSANPFDMF